MFLSYPSASYPENFSPALETHYPRSEKENRGFVFPGIGIIWLGLPNLGEPFQTATCRSCLPAGRVCTKLRASLCGFPNGPRESPFTAIGMFWVAFSRDYLWACPLIATQGWIHGCLVPVSPINGHMLPAFRGAWLVAPSWRLFASDFINFLLHYFFLSTS